MTDTLLKCATETELRGLFEKVSICLTTPLFYTRLGEDILTRAGIDIAYVCRGSLLGQMFETYIRGAVVLRSVSRTLSSVKLWHGEENEVDIFDAGRELLLEATVRDKDDKEVNVYKYFIDDYFIRVCGTRGKRFFDGVYHRIPYPVLACMADTGDIYELPPSQGMTDTQKVEMAAAYSKARQPADKTHDIVIGLVHNKEDKRVGLQIWRHATQTAEIIPMPNEMSTWNLDIVSGRLYPKFCNLSDFPILMSRGGDDLLRKDAPGDDKVVRVSAGWVIGEYKNGNRLRIMAMSGQVKDVTQTAALSYYERHGLANADNMNGKLVGKLNRWFERIE